MGEVEEKKGEGKEERMQQSFALMLGACAFP